MAAIVVSRLRGTGSALRSRIYGEARVRAIAEGAQLLFAGVEPSGDRTDAGRTTFALSFSTKHGAANFAASLTGGLLKDVAGLEVEVIIVDGWTPTIGESPTLI